MVSWDGGEGEVGLGRVGEVIDAALSLSLYLYGLRWFSVRLAATIFVTDVKTKWKIHVCTHASIRDHEDA